MGIALTQALLLGLALAMDAFAVALTQGARFRPGIKGGTLIALAFGIAQGVMPFFGWIIGATAMQWIAAWDHWIAFALLAFIGGRMVLFTDDGEEEGGARLLTGSALFVAALATSIDALAAGLTLPTLGLEPVLACVIIALVTFALSAIGVALGGRAGDRFGRPAEVFGGLILVGIGAKILFEHLMLL